MIDFLMGLANYEMLRLAWWVFMLLIVIGFSITGGFDLGITTLLPFIAHNDVERRVIINSIGPTWEGNQTWLVLAGGALFAAWPLVYAAAFSSLFIGMFILLFALILRPAGFKFRSLLPSTRWRSMWDWALFAGGIIPAVLLGVVVGNLFLGIPFRFDDELRLSYDGSFMDLLSPFGLLAGIATLSMLVMHGGIYLQLKTEGFLHFRAQRVVKAVGPLVLITFSLLAWAVGEIGGYQYVSVVDPSAVSNPLLKEVAVVQGAWLHNFSAYPWMRIAPLVGVIAFLGAWCYSSYSRWPGRAFFLSTIFVAASCTTAGFALLPFIMPSSLDAVSSLTIWDATASRLTLVWLTVVTLVLLPIVVAYTSWVFSKLRGTVTVEQVQQQPKTYY